MLPGRRLKQQICEMQAKVLESERRLLEHGVAGKSVPINSPFSFECNSATEPGLSSCSQEPAHVACSTGQPRTLWYTLSNEPVTAASNYYESQAHQPRRDSHQSQRNLDRSDSRGEDRTCLTLDLISTCRRLQSQLQEVFQQAVSYQVASGTNSHDMGALWSNTAFL